MLKNKNETLKFGLGFSLILFLILLVCNFFFFFSYWHINISYTSNNFFYKLIFKTPIIIFHYFIELIFIRLIPRVINKVIIFSVFYLFFTPLSLLFNLFGFSKNFVIYKKKNSYWKKVIQFKITLTNLF